MTSQQFVQSTDCFKCLTHPVSEFINNSLSANGCDRTKADNRLFSKLDAITDTDTVVCNSANSSKTVDVVVDPRRDISPTSGCLVQSQSTSQAMCTRHGPVSDVTMHRLQEAEGNSAAEVSVKRRKSHMNVIECSRHSATENGGQPLKTPALTKTSSKKP